MNKLTFFLLATIYFAGCSGVSRVEKIDSTQKHAARIFIELKKWPEAQKVQFFDGTIEILDTEKCMSPAPAFAECFTYTTFKDIQKMKGKGPPEARKMVLTYNKSRHTVTADIFKWNGKKFVKTTNSKNNPIDRTYKELVIKWSFQTP